MLYLRIRILANQDGKHLNEVQFGVALALLGQTEKKEELKELFDDLAISDGLAVDGFFIALNRYASCPVLSCPVLSCPVLSCPVLSCPVLSRPVPSVS